MKSMYKKYLCILVIVLPTILTGCVGADYTPDYFGLRQSGDATQKPLPNKEPKVKDSESITVYKVMTGEDGRQIEIPIPTGKILEVGNGTFVARSETDLGDKYTATAKFKIVNSGEKQVNVSLPAQIGPFYLSSGGNLKYSLGPEQFTIITVTFSPNTDNCSGEGEIEEEIELSKTTFKLFGVALKASGLATINIINSDGNIKVSDASMLTFPEIALSANPVKQYFQCKEISCNGEVRYTSCVPCINVLGGSCKLLTVNSKNEPIDAVTSNCKPVTNNKSPSSEINLASTDLTSIKVQKKIIEIINTGNEPLVIDHVKIREAKDSASTEQFSINTKAIFMADSFQEVQKKILTAFDTGAVFESETFPTVLPPYDPPVLTTRLYAVVSYHPNDVLGSDGIAAAVGSSSKDTAYLEITSKERVKNTELVGTTTVREIPALQVFVKSSNGMKSIVSNSVLPLKGITTDTANLAIPLFMKLSDSASTTIKITGITIKGDNFEWLDTTEKIGSKNEDVRCIIPIYDEKGAQIDLIENPEPISLGAKGFTIEPGIYTLDTMPFFGCINFFRDSSTTLEKVSFSGEINITAQELTSSGQVALNPDGSIKETIFTFGLLGVIDPLQGPSVLRLTQTMAGVMNPKFPSISSVASEDEMNLAIAEGIASEADREVFIMAIHLDPFDDNGDGVTALFTPIDTRAVPQAYDDPKLKDYTSLIHDSLLPKGERGIFDSYDVVPNDFRETALKIYTSSLSYPGPIAPPEEQPFGETQCEVVDPCTAEGQRKLGEGSNNPNYKGVCAYFFVTAGDRDSPAFNYPTENPPGNRREMCADRETPYELDPIEGVYTLDGRMEFERAAIFFQGPTYFHNPSGPLGPVSPLDEKFNVNFTTEVLLPISETKTVDRLPDKRIDVAKGEYKINLNDPYSDLPQLCPTNMKNRYLQGEYFSTWKYIAPLLWKDKEATIRAGCPEEDNDFTGGVAYISGKRLDQKTGHATFVTASKFSSSDNLTFAFKDVMLFLVLNGWFCDPYGPEEDMEGTRCFDKNFNYRDAMTQSSIVK